MPGPGRNAGAAAVQTDLLLFLDADMLLPDAFFLENMINEFEKRELDIATVDVVLFQGSWGDKMLHRVYNFYVRMMRPLIVHAPGSCILVRRSWHEQINGFDPTVLFCEDHDYANRAWKAGAKFGFLNSTRIGATVRRQDRDGRVRLMTTYILAELHLWFLGPIRHNGFRYGFGYGKKGR